MKQNDPAKLTDEQIKKRGERYAHTVITYSKRVGTSTGQYERIVVADAFTEGYKSAITDWREFNVHKLECHADCAEGRHHKYCAWKQAHDNLFREKF